MTKNIWVLLDRLGWQTQYLTLQVNIQAHGHKVLFLTIITSGATPNPCPTVAPDVAAAVAKSTLDCTIVKLANEALGYFKNHNSKKLILEKNKFQKIKWNLSNQKKNYNSKRV